MPPTDDNPIRNELPSSGVVLQLEITVHQKGEAQGDEEEIGVPELAVKAGHHVKRRPSEENDAEDNVEFTRAALVLAVTDGRSVGRSAFGGSGVRGGLVAHVARLCIESRGGKFPMDH